MVRPARRGMAAIEIVMLIGALMPISVGLWMMLRAYLAYHHAHVGYVTGSPLM